MFSKRTHFVNRNLPSDHYLLSNYRANALHALVREIGRIACSQPQRLATATTIDYGTTACLCGAQVVADNGNGIRTDATQVTADVDAVMGDDARITIGCFLPASSQRMARKRPAS